MSFCDFVPDDPSCAPAPVPEPVPVDPVDPVEPVDPVDPVEPTEPTDPVEPKPEVDVDGEKAEGDDKMSSEAMWGNIGFLMVAISHVVHPALDMFRYTSGATYWDVTDTTFGAGATNWWKLYNQIGQYGMLSVGAILTITQLLSMFGIAAEVNVMLWGYATMLVGPLLGAAISGIAMWGYDQAYQLCDADSSTNADACAIMGEIEGDMLWQAVGELSMGAALMESYEGWMQAQFMALPAETQKLWMEEHMKEEMMKKEMMMMKAKELGIEMDKGSDSEWSESDKEDMDYEKEEMAEEM